MLITKCVNITLSSSNINIYKGLGYTIPYHIDNRGRKVSKGETLNVDIKDLLKSSKERIEFTCDNCSKNGIETIINTMYNVYTRKGHKDLCSNCMREYRSNKMKLSYEYIKNEIETLGLKLLTKEENYIDTYSDIDIVCICGKVFTTKYRNFKSDNKKQCDECGIALRSKENSPRWQGGITDELDKLRKSKEYKEWRTRVLKRDNYTCQCCGDNKGGNLHAHHIRNFKDNEDLRFDVNNGITLCDKCHNPSIKNSFHHLYGTHNNTYEQLKEYIKLQTSA